MYVRVHPFAPLVAQTTISTEAIFATQYVQATASHAQLPPSVPHVAQVLWSLALIYVHLVQATVMHARVQLPAQHAAPITSSMEEIYATLPAPATASPASSRLLALHV